MSIIIQMIGFMICMGSVYNVSGICVFYTYVSFSAQKQSKSCLLVICPQNDF